MEPTILGLVLDSSVIIAAERRHESVHDLLLSVRRAVGEVDIAMSAVTVAELVHGVFRANTPEIRERRRAFINELKRHVPTHPVTDAAAEIAGEIGGRQASVGVNIPIDDLFIGASALEQGYAVATLNVRHFGKIPGLQVLTL